MSIISIIGRPNTGKSTLFNRMIGAREAVVHSTPNLTRDRHYGEYEWRDREFILIDTGGIEAEENTAFIKLVEEQADIAINESELILFVVDNKDGITSDDHYIAKKLRLVHDKVLLVINKWDNMLDEIDPDIYSLGFEKIIKVSAEHKVNTDLLKQHIFKNLPLRKIKRKDGIKLAVVGKPNVGKSSFVNTIMRDNRMIVSDIPGTTRDSVDSHMNYKNEHFVLIDTAGIRRASKIKEPTEYYTVLRSKLAIKKSDIIIVIMDVNEGITKQDKKILDEAMESLKPVIICLNKIDLIVDKDKNEYYDELKKKMKFANYLPFINTSFKNSKNVFKILDKSIEMNKYLPLKFKNANLNILLFEIISKRKHPIKPYRRVRFYRLFQVSEKPLKFVVESSAPSNIDNSYKRYIINSMRKELKIPDINFRVYFRDKTA